MNMDEGRLTDDDGGSWRRGRDRVGGDFLATGDRVNTTLDLWLRAAAARSLSLSLTLLATAVGSGAGHRRLHALTLEFRAQFPCVGAFYTHTSGTLLHSTAGHI
jgi:hypothetical protein